MKTQTMCGILPYDWQNFETNFAICSLHFPMLDCILYLEENVKYESARIDRYLTILVHPTEDRVVGLKVECISEIAQTLCDAVHAASSMPEDGFEYPFPLRQAIGFAYLLNETDNKFDKGLTFAYANAREFVEHVTFDPYTILRNAMTKILV